jgi:putative transposase
MKLAGINQLCVADITYIRLKAEFVYLAVILDGFLAKWWAGHWIELWQCD